MNKNIFLFLFFFFQYVSAQHTEILKLNAFSVSTLSDSVRENSGLDFLGARLFTFNDSGNSSELFELDSHNGKILNVFQTGLRNTDWEALANDGRNFFIGDFGNNAGTRKDLKIYKMPFESMASGTERAPTSDSVRVIPFYYPEQNDFTPRNINNDFDAEAMIFLNGKIHLFTKEWASKATTHYIIDPDIPEDQPAVKAEQYKTGFVVTDAAYFAGKLFLVGYTKATQVYLMVFEESRPGIFFEGNPVKYYLGSALSVGQIEGITVDENGIYISGEAFKTPLGTRKQAYYFIPAKDSPF